MSHLSSRMILILSIQQLANSLASVYDESCMGSGLHLLLLKKLLIRKNYFLEFPRDSETKFDRRVVIFAFNELTYTFLAS